MLLSSCAVIPVTEYKYVEKCGITHDKNTLKLIDVAKETHTYYSVGGLMISPLIVPVSTVLSATYIATNEIYYFGKQLVICE